MAKTDQPTPILDDANFLLHHGTARSFLQNLPEQSMQLIITSPPYCIGQEYEKGIDLKYFQEIIGEVLADLVRVLKPGGSMAWQVGYQAKKNELFPLDYTVYSIMLQFPQLKLRNRIIWTFGHGHHLKRRFSGRHEIILWFTKGDEYTFDLDSVRVPQKYPGKKHYKGAKKGQFSGNPGGKNPSDVWEIPNVKAAHIEKTAHPCQFPVGLADRLIRALSATNDWVLDPFMGSGSTGVAALINQRRFVGIETHKPYVDIAKCRVADAMHGKARYRAVDLPVRLPKPSESVSKAPDHFVRAQRVKAVEDEGRRSCNRFKASVTGGTDD